ncbi:MAG TPA: HAD-IA family hydrolase [Gemmatimonadaceae bacterium]
MVDVALVELEGVVFETRELRYASVRDALIARAIEPPPSFDANTIAGLTQREAVALGLAVAEVEADDVLIDLMMHAADRAFSARLSMGGVLIRPGARAFLEEAAITARLGVVTRANRADADTMLRLSGLESAFVVTVCADDTFDPKPSPDCYELAIGRLERLRPVTPGAALALEDSAAGLRAARAAKLRSIAIGPVPAHVAMEADAFVSTLVGQTLATLDQLSRPGQERVQ